ncbi:Sialin [Strongyloides ratti]|uniref:Sialin n=1 Tax=Strongyloides ratti TaxID=34506 RepID=A0A090LP10_STRRB|nr:Sialin [Strongyloides ratti]CEF69924.1 Sialin [Strongyloides ratti]
MTGMTLFYFARTTIGISMICMLNSTSFQNESITKHEIPKKCQYIFNNTIQKSKIYEGTINWNQDVQNSIISANYWGSLLTIFFAGIIVDKTSPKKTIILSASILLITTALFPILTIYWDYNLVIISRFIFGIGDAFWAPSFNHILSNWIPLNEKSLAVGIYTSGVQIAILLGNPISALFCNSFYSWPGTFYFCATLILIFIIIWIILIQNSFDNDKWLTKNEHTYLLRNMSKNETNNKEKHIKILWLNIVTSLPLLSIMICRISEMIYIVFSTTFFPLYLRDTLYINIINNGIYSAAPFTAQIISKITIGAIIGKLQRKKILTSTQSVKICQFISGIGVLVGLFIAPYINDCTNHFPIVICFSFILFFFGISANGFFTSIYILSPPLITTITSLNLFVGVLGAGSTSYIISYLKSLDKYNGWNNVLRFIGIIWFLTSFFFTIFGSGEKQNWIEERSKDKYENNTLLNKKIINNKNDEK